MGDHSRDELTLQRMRHLSQVFCWLLLVSSVLSIPYSHLKQLREQMKGIDRNDDTDRLLQVDKALFIKETAISLLLEVKLFPFWNLVPDDVGDEGQISTAPHRRTYDTEESPVEEEGDRVLASLVLVSTSISPVVTASVTYWKIPSNLLHHR